MSAQPSLELRQVHKRFGNTEIIRGVDLRVEAGERVAIIGPNGAGKSTLFNLISGRFAPSQGEIYLHGQRIDGREPFEINRLGLSRSFQITNIFPKLSVFENLRCAVLWQLGHRYSFWSLLGNLKDANDLAHAWMARIHLTAKRDALAMNLTYAEQRALEVGITLAGGANVVLLDEPTGGLDTESEIAIVQRLASLKDTGLIMVTHSQRALALTDRIVVLEHGRLLADGKTQEMWVQDNPSANTAKVAPPTTPSTKGVTP